MTYTLKDINMNTKNEEVFTIQHLGTDEIKDIDIEEYITLKNKGEID